LLPSASVGASKSGGVAKARAPAAVMAKRGPSAPPAMPKVSGLPSGSVAVAW
jgi:hypothetical protein